MSDQQSGGEQSQPPAYDPAQPTPGAAGPATASSNNAAAAEEDDEETTRRRRRWLLLFIVLLILLLLCLGGALWYIFKGRTNPNPSAGPSASTSTSSFSPPPSSNSPPPTSPSPSNSPTPPPPIAVPNVVGMAADQAETTLKGAGFSKVTFVSDDGSAVQVLNQWKVTKQTPAAGTQADPSTEIVLTVHNTAGSGAGTGKG